jgi:chemotaxis signal transduction protein
MVQKMQELLLFQIGAMQLGMDLSYVMNIQGASGIASEQAEKQNRFASMAEGHNVALYNLSAILGVENSAADPENEKLIVVNAQDQPVGLIVERVDRVIKVANDQIEPLSPIFQGPSLSCFPKVLKHEGKLVLLLAPQGMVDIIRQMQKYQDLREGLDSKSKDESRSEVKSADTVIAEMILKSRQNVMNLGMKPKPHINSGRTE